MPSLIDITKPVQGQATTLSIRDNFIAAKAEIEALQAQAAGGDMLKSVYDTDLDGIVDEAERLTTNARNSTGALIPKGSVVYINGASGQNPTIALALANAKATSASTIGIVTADIANNAVGLISTAGKIHNLNTSAYAEGATVYLSPTVPGGITVTKPIQPNIIVRIGFIAYSHNANGLLILAILAGPDLDDNQVVLFTNKQDGDVLTYELATSLWKNKPSSGYPGIPQNPQSANYTLALTDTGKHLLHPSADTTARTFTIPAYATVAFPTGSAVSFVNQNGGGVVTIAITTDTMRLAGAGTTGSRSLAANGVATALKITNTEWIISGVGLT